MASLADYLRYITSEHSDKPRYVAAVAAAVKPFADMQFSLFALIEAYDLDNAVGVQLDTIGLWVGVSRYVSIPKIQAFSFEVEGAGFSDGWWWDPTNLESTINYLDDAAYRVLLRSRIVNNTWNGSIPQAYEIWNLLFKDTPYRIELIDNQDMTMRMNLISKTSSIPTIVEALFRTGYLDIKPAGVQMNNHIKLPASVWDGGSSIWDAGESVWDFE